MARGATTADRCPSPVKRGGQVLRLDLAGIGVEVRSPDAEWMRWSSRRFDAFRSESSPAILFEHLPGPGEPQFRRSGNRVVLEGAMHPRFLDVALTELLPYFLAPALMFHGTLLSDASNTYLCCGPSGAGKTTLASMLVDRALCDELAAVREGARGFEGISLPYWNARPGSGPLAGVFVLEHAGEHRRERLGVSRAIRELRSHVCWPAEDRGATIRSFTALTSLAQRVPVWRLGFRKDPGVWELIAGSSP